MTSFPNSWGNEDSDLYSAAAARAWTEGESTAELAHTIIRASMAFFDREGPMGFKLEEGFRASINNIVMIPRGLRWRAPFYS